METSEDRRKKLLFSYFLNISYVFIPASKSSLKKRKANAHRDRSRVDSVVDSWSDSMFLRQFRLPRDSFMYLLLLIEERFPISEQSKRLAINSSGSYISNKKW